MNRVNLITAVLAVAIVGLLSTFLANVSGTSVTDSFSTAVKQDDETKLKVSAYPSRVAGIIVRANATNVVIFAASTNTAWIERKVINPTTSAVYINYSTNAPSAGASDDVIPPSVATNTYDSYITIPSSVQAQITASTTGLQGYGIQKP